MNKEQLIMTIEERRKKLDEIRKKHPSLSTIEYIAIKLSIVNNVWSPKLSVDDALKFIESSLEELENWEGI